MSNEFENDEWFDENEDINSLSDALLTFTIMPKPFGMTWKVEHMKKFLKARGYRVLDRFDEETENSYCVVVKKNESRIPGPGEGKGNIVEVFSDEVQTILLEWLLKIGKKNDT